MTEPQGRGPRPVEELVPENAPFDEEQRAWLNGFLAGLLGLTGGESRVPVSAVRAPAGANAPSSPAVTWRDPTLPLERRLELSEGESHERRLMSALGQLDCGQCGYSCQGYATALASLAEKDATLCAPGGRATARALKSLLAEQIRATRGSGAWPVAGTLARRPVRVPDSETPPPVGSEKAATPVLADSAGAQRHPHHVRVKSQRKLTLADAGSEIREVILDLTGSQVQYRAGDSLAILPHNDPDLVRALLRAVGARGQEMVTTPGGSCEVWRCLLEDVDITHVRSETLQLFANQAGEGPGIGELLREGTPAGFDLLDLLAMFPNARPSIDQIVGTLGPLTPRVYAIASSPTVHPDEAHLAVRVVRAERGGRERKGVASHFLTEGVFRGDELAVYLQTNERPVLPEERSGPLILLCSGTGMARHRAFLEELEARGRRGNTWLIMASCFDGDEALYEAELKAWSRLGVLEHLDLIKPSLRGRRTGPQDILRKRARRVVSWLDRGAIVYACGEGKSLAAVLTDTLIEVLGRHGKMSRTEAVDFVHLMRREGRYVEEVY